MHWQFTIDLKQDWPKAADGRLAPCALAGIIAHKLQALPVLPDSELDTRKTQLIALFTQQSRDEDLDFERFNQSFEQLYDWADHNSSGQPGKLCWIAI